jgi:hypothetical protein
LAEIIRKKPVQLCLKMISGDSLHQLDSLEEPHDFEDAKHFDGSENPLIAVHDCNTVPCHTLLQWAGTA